MKSRILMVFLFVVAVSAMSASVSAQSRQFHNGSVWSIGFIQMKPGMDNAYLEYVATDWKKEQEALKTDGQILSYMVIQTEGHSSTDWNLMLMTEYKDLATLEADEAKADALLQKVIGNDAKQMQGYRERLQIREVMGNRIGRQITLTPRH